MIVWVSDARQSALAHRVMIDKEEGIVFNSREKPNFTSLELGALIKGTPSERAGAR